MDLDGGGKREKEVGTGSSAGSGEKNQVSEGGTLDEFPNKGRGNLQRPRPIEGLICHPAFKNSEPEFSSFK